MSQFRTQQTLYSLVPSGDYRRRSVLDSYLKFLVDENLAISQRYVSDVSDCGTKSMPWNCVGDGHHRGYRPMMCRNPLCPFCSGVFSKRLVDYLLYRVQAIYSKLHRKISFWRYEFTVPPDHAVKLGMGGLPSLDKLAKEVLVEYLGKSEGLQMGIVQVPQFHRSKDPFGVGKFGGFHPHVHGVCFDFGFDEKKGRVVPFSKMFLDRDPNFVRLRALWRAKLESVFGPTSAKDVDAFIRYEDKHGYAELVHRFVYMFRSCVGDFYNTVKLSGVPKGYDPVWVNSALVGCKGRQRIHYYGWLSSRSMSPKSPFMKFLGLELLSRKAYSAERRKVSCPVCGCDMEPDLGGVEDTAELLRLGAFFLVPASGFGFQGGG